MSDGEAGPFANSGEYFEVSVDEVDRNHESSSPSGSEDNDNNDFELKPN